MLKPWNELPNNIQNEAVKPYYDLLKKKQGSLWLKRIFDFFVALILIILLSPIILILAIMIKCDSRGPIIFRQERVTQYGVRFHIYKFRTMKESASKDKVQLTKGKDHRITRVGHLIRKVRLDELPQLFNVIKGEMTFVGTRPEVSRYVEQYTPEMYATLLLPAGITSKASIEFKDEDEILAKAEDIEKTYITQVLPLKMQYNLNSLKAFSFLGDLKIMVQTVVSVLR